MWRSLLALRALPGKTQVYCGHNYTAENIEFALHLEPDSLPLRKRLEHAVANNRRGHPTVPSTIGEEIATNPFMRADDAVFAKRVGVADKAPADVFKSLRDRKDCW